MHKTVLLACSFMGIGLSVASVTGALGDAIVVNDNPVGPVYEADLLCKETTDLRGSITATASNDGVGVIFKVDFSGFPDEQQFGPFSQYTRPWQYHSPLTRFQPVYHIHDQPVPADGNCTKTLAHLDPFIRGEVPPCDPTNPATCQVGDLSGKHGNITNVGGGKHFVAEYVDLYASTKPGIGAFLGNRSIVVHTNNKTRINCGNFNMVSCAASGDCPATTARSVTIPACTIKATGAATRTGANGSPTSSMPPFQNIATQANVVSVLAGIILTALVAFML
jgi:hypothetical protein